MLHTFAFTNKSNNYMKKLLTLSFIFLILAVSCSVFAQSDSTGLKMENICYTLLSQAKKYGSFKGDNIKIDSTDSKYYSFLFSCNMDRILEVQNIHSWKTFYVLSTDENKDDSFTYNCLGTDSKKYIFILEMESKTLTKIYDNNGEGTLVEINMINEVVEHKK